MDKLFTGKQFVFICGLHKSGTSLIHEILREHKEISGFKNTRKPQDEGQHLQNVFPTAADFGGPGRFGFNPSAYMDETHPTVAANARSRLLTQWRNYWDLKKPLLIEKSPPNIIRTRYLQALFPNAKFIVIRRHPIVVGYATAKEEWCSCGEFEAIVHAIHCNELFESDKKRLQQCQLVRYEELLDRPQETLDEIAKFLGIKRIENPRHIDPDKQVKYVHQWKLVFDRLHQTSPIELLKHRLKPLGYGVDPNHMVF
ncbi:sulfotransferase family protein [Thalassoroseus pseudoceratinae]|uniref:sulfotransferase family protein n=1 Tax=Thalassoroseus pseudoceratinae TaxID=2713176 RepID=UPI001423503B|nr:sulfotransferase [Thalassoroseus pseudoceratinae]